MKMKYYLVLQRLGSRKKNKKIKKNNFVLKPLACKQ
jgi:hypothetical protein